jgi:glycosyltransferase involved in cell wall biosynthesis
MDMANLGLAEYLGRRGEETHIVTHRADAAVSKLPSVVTHIVIRPLGSNLLGEVLLERAAWSVYRKLKSRRPIVVVNGGNVRLPRSVNWVHFVHKASDGDLAYFRRLVRFRNIRRERLALGGAEVVVADSQRTAADLRNLLALDPSKIATIYYGIDRARFLPAAPEEKARLARNVPLSFHPYHAVFVGGLGDGRKGFATVFSAWEMLERMGGLDVGLVVVGTGREEQKWQRLARQREVTGIQFLGFRPDVSAIIRSVDVMVAPSLYEPYGLAVHEALCCGIPAITSDTSGVAEQFTPELKPLLLHDPRSVEELVQKVVAWRAEIERYKGAVVPLSSRLRARSWDDMARDIMKLCGGHT